MKLRRAEIATRAGKRRFIRLLMNRYKADLLEKVAKMPPEWDGHELRWLTADTLAAEQYHADGRNARYRDYQSERLTRNL